MSVRWGVMGTADIAAKVGTAINRADNSELIAIASRSRERAEAWAAKRGVNRSYGSYQELLQDADVDAVYIPLPPSMHSRWAIAAAEAGKHVLCEKPLAMDIDEALAIADACRNNQVQLMDGVMWVHHDWTGQVRQFLNSGELGELRRVTANFTFNWGDEIPVEDIRAQKDLGGGSLGDLGYYCVRVSLWAFGEMPVRVRAHARFANNVDIEMSGTLFFRDERVATFDCGYTMEFRAALEIAGTKGAIVVDPYVVPESEEQSSFTLSKGHDRERFPVGSCVQEVKMIERFSGLVSSGNLEPRWSKEALDTVRVCVALAESAGSGREVEL